MSQHITQEWLEILRCVRCGNSLEQVPSLPLEWPTFNEVTGPTALQCVQCHERYPITVDEIPILWTDELRDCLCKDRGSSSALAANISIYNKVSDAYARFWRKDSGNARRMLSAANKAMALQNSSSPRGNLRHLDVGCGPGHVLHWLSDLPTHQFAVDVSLANLRNTMRSTRAFVALASAARLPFADNSFDLVSESSVLHHIESWSDAVSEFARVCNHGGGLVLDSEPSREGKQWSRLATLVFELRWYPYHLMSFFSSRKFWFRNLKNAKVNFDQAEIHNRPNTGLPVESIVAMLRDRGLTVDAIRSPNDQLQSRYTWCWQDLILHLLSGHNPFDTWYGPFMIVGQRPLARSQSVIVTEADI